jgi:hypothetical protein
VRTHREQVAAESIKVIAAIRVPVTIPVSARIVGRREVAACV